MNRLCIISKKKVKLAYILMSLSIISCILCTFNQIFVFLIITFIILYGVVIIKYIRCSNCDCFIGIGELPYFNTPKYCRHCGSKIEFES